MAASARATVQRTPHAGRAGDGGGTAARRNRLAILRPRHWLLVSVLLVEAVLLVNAGWHVVAALVRGGYAPGVITAVVINLPFGVYVLRRAVREQWIRPRTAWRLMTIALVLHIAALGSLLAG